jgi:hypothetical protein
VEADGVALRFDQPRIEGTIAAVDDQADTFRTAPALPACAAGSTVVVSNTRYTHASAYRIASVSADGSVAPRRSGLTLGRARVERFDDGRLESSSPLVFGYEYDRSTRFLDGKRITAGRESGHVIAADGFDALRTERIAPARGVPFVVHDVQVGDRIRLDSTGSLTRRADGTWELSANVPVAVTLPDGNDGGGGGGTRSFDAAALARGPVNHQETR